MPLFFQQLYNSKTKFLQSYIDYILMYNKRGDFVRDVVFRAWEFWGRFTSNTGSKETLKESKEIYHKITFERVRKHLDAHFTDTEMTLILAEKERLADLRRAKKKAWFDEQHQKGIIQQRTRKLRLLEIQMMRDMGYSIKQIAEEFRLSRSRIEHILIVEAKKNKDNEIEYLLGVLEGIQVIRPRDIKG